MEAYAGFCAFLGSSYINIHSSEKYFKQNLQQGNVKYIFCLQFSSESFAFSNATYNKKNNKKKLLGLSPRAHYTDLFVGEFSAHLRGYGVPRGQRDGSPTAVISVSRPEPLLFLPSSSSVVLTRLSGPRSRPTTSQKNLVAPGTEPAPLDL
jgi:hypothetical protein